MSTQREDDMNVRKSAWKRGLLTAVLSCSMAALGTVAVHGAEVASSKPRSFDLDTMPRVPPANGTILDFETDDERALVPSIDNASCRVFVTNRFATSGEHSVAFVCADWRPGMEIWPSFTINIKTSDWTGYDRLSIDVVNFGEGRATGMGIIIGGPEGRIQQGYKVGTKLPEKGYLQWIVPLSNFHGTVSHDAVTRVHFFTSNPVGFAVAIDRLTLLRPGEEPPAPDGPHVGRDLWPRLAAKQREMQSRLDEGDGYALDVLRFRRACREEGVISSAMLIGEATSMEKILPRGRFSVRPLTKRGLSVRLAGNEYESVQILVMPKGDGLKGVKVAVDGFDTFAATNISCAVMGYVSVTSPPPYWVGYNVPSDAAPGYLRKVRPAELGWWPDPILDFLDAVDVNGEDIQGFWVRVHCPKGQPAGLYRGTLSVSADGVDPVRVPFSVRVNGFSLGHTSELPLAITFKPNGMGAEAKKRIAASPDAPVKLWTRHKAEWVGFLADYLIPFDNLYDWGNPERLFAQRQLCAEGRSGLMNLCYWGPVGKMDEASLEQYRQRTVGMIKGSYERAMAAGQKKFYAYGCDELTSDAFPRMRAAALEIKKSLPGIPLSTTAYDHNFGVGTPLDVIDWFTPLTPSYDMEKAAASRRAGHQVWWYVCSQPPPPYANVFIESPAIETRLLMGAMTQRMKPDGFLYYQTSIWNATNCITACPFTEWDIRTFLDYHGDGNLTYVGPDGIPLPSLRLENFRDGLEDYAYAKLLEEKLGAVESSFAKAAVDKGSQNWIRRARAALAVPCSVMDTMTNYTDDPAALYRWRDGMADLVEEAERLLAPLHSTQQRKEN